jgi:hypothetical protein
MSLTLLKTWIWNSLSACSAEQKMSDVVFKVNRSRIIEVVTNRVPTVSLQRNMVHYSSRNILLLTLIPYYIHSVYDVVSRGSSVSIVSGYGLDDWAIEVRFPTGERIFPLPSVSRPALRPTQPPLQWVSGVLSPGQSAAWARRWPLTPSSAEVTNE